MVDTAIELSDGREIAYTDIGSPQGDPILFFHGAPSSRLRLTGHEQRYEECDLRVISPDRPGYGCSSPKPYRDMNQWADDVEALVDALDIDNFAVAGHSSGGPYAVLCSAILKDRVTAGLVLAGITNMEWDQAWHPSLGHELSIMRKSDEESAVDWCRDKYGADGQHFPFTELYELPELDRPHLEEANNAMDEAFRQGVEGFARDIFVQARPWDFDYSNISCPIEVLHGGEDNMVPIAHSRHTAEIIPDSSFRLLPKHGHLSILTAIPDFI